MTPLEQHTGVKGTMKNVFDISDSDRELYSRFYDHVEETTGPIYESAHEFEVFLKDYDQTKNH